MRLEEIEAVPGPGTLTWRPVRLTLGVEAFGTNAYTAEEAGVDVVEPHTESPEFGHQELYFVASGHARFTLDGTDYDAPAGTYVFVPDTATHRHAVAEEPGTTVLSFGGPPVFKPSPWEWTFRAMHLKDSDPDAAQRLLEEGLEAWPDSPSLKYGLACWNSLHGDKQRAIDLLGEAIEREPKVREWAQGDEDLLALREEAAFKALVDR